MTSKVLAFSPYQATETEDGKELSSPTVSTVTSMDDKSPVSNEAGPKRCETRCMKIGSTYRSIMLL